MGIRIGRVPHASYTATADAARAGALEAEHVATIAAAWQAPTGTGATFAALASGYRVATGALLDAITDAIVDATGSLEVVAVLEALERWVALEDPCDPAGPCDDEGPCEAHSVVLASRWDGSGTADDMAASYVLEIADRGADVPADVLAIARRTSGWLGDPDDAQAIHDAATYADGPAGTYTLWDGGWTLYRITGGPLEH